MPIRWRLTLWSALILAGVLLVSGLVLQTLLQRYLVEAIDGNLRFYAGRVHGSVTPAELPSPADYNVIHSRLPQIDEFGSPGVYIQLVDASGKVVVKSDSLGDKELPLSPELLVRGLDGYSGIETVATTLEGAYVRILISPMRLKESTLVLQVAESMKHVQDTVVQLRWALASSVLVALVLAGVSGWFIVRSALAPVRAVTRTARAIEAGPDLARRVGYKGPSDEVGQLAVTFDRMLDRLNRVFTSQRYFVADASHELRSPLAVIRGNLDLLKRAPDAGEQAQSLMAITMETERMVKIVNDLLLLAEIESGQVQRQELVSLGDIFSEEYDRAIRSGPNHNIVLGKQDDLTVVGDSHMVAQAVGNLINNAIKYTPAGTTVTLSLFRSGDWACLQVRDSGPGIAREHLPHLFDRFYRVDKARSRAQGGTGLGLAIVKGIAERDGGRVTVESEPGKGSTFTIWLKLTAL